ncbi:amidohydrolase family protein [Paenibacillus solisilvae]|uniref:Amidohydrolase family protein n=1 Tax=Paenibacillus solisilvae TaxID=2486751 RepID=A0ABW0W1G9_9BACL
MRIDAHLQIGVGRYYRVDPGHMIEQMDRCGIDQALVSPVDREMAVYNREGNDRVLALSKQFPGRFLAYATANPWYEGAAVAELERALGEGAAAVKLHPPLQGFMILESLVYPLIEVAARHRAPIYVHTGTPVYALPLQLAELALTYPEVSFIMGKNGKTDFTMDALPALEKASNLYGDTAHDFPERGMARLSKKIGPERLIFSSNHPVSRIELEVDKVRELAVNDDDKAAVMGGNMQRLLAARFH